MSRTSHQPKINSELPSFKSPPVVEVVMGVQFRPLSKFQTPHVGLFWETVRPDYSTSSENPPIVPQIEEFTSLGALRDNSLAMTRIPPLPRVFFEHTSSEWIIQLQRDRFLHNWRLVSGQAVYPRYPAIREEFFSQWANFRKFVADQELGEIEVTQVEITYLNHIFPWEEHAELGEVFPDFRWRGEERLLSKPETHSISCTFKSSKNRSRLRATIKPGTHKEKGHILLFDLTARGAPEEESLEEWFDEARRWIVTAFADLTSHEWHEKWGGLS